MEDIGAAAGVAGAATAIGGAIAQAIPTHRQCTIYLTNECHDYTLRNPRMYSFSGRCHVPFSPTIHPQKSDSAQFTKTQDTARGAVGVFTYDLVHSTEQSAGKMAVMFSVPYDFNCYSNWYAVGVFDDSKTCDYDLFNLMYNNSGTFVRDSPSKMPSITHRGHQVTVMATMSNSFQPTMKVEVTQN